MTGSTSLPASHYGYRTGFYRNRRRIEEPNPLMFWLSAGFAKGYHAEIQPSEIIVDNHDDAIDAILYAHDLEEEGIVWVGMMEGGMIMDAILIAPSGRLTRNETWIIAQTNDSPSPSRVSLEIPELADD